jgi:hypothetical protein
MRLTPRNPSAAFELAVRRLRRGSRARRPCRSRRRRRRRRLQTNGCARSPDVRGLHLGSRPLYRLDDVADVVEALAPLLEPVGMDARSVQRLAGDSRAVCRTWFLWEFTAKLAGQRMASRPGQRPLLERLGLGCAPRLGEQLGQVDDLRFEPGPPDALLELAVTAGVDRHHDVHVRLLELSKLVGEDAPRVVRS